MTNRKVNINSTKGKQVIKNYINFLQFAGRRLADSATALIQEHSTPSPTNPGPRYIPAVVKGRICTAIKADKDKFCPGGAMGDDGKHKNSNIRWKHNMCLSTDKGDNTITNQNITLNEELTKAKRAESIEGKKYQLAKVQSWLDDYETCAFARRRELEFLDGHCPNTMRNFDIDGHKQSMKKMNKYASTCQRVVNAINEDIEKFMLKKIYSDLNKLPEHLESLSTGSKSLLYGKLFPKRETGSKKKKTLKIQAKDPYNTETIDNNMKVLKIVKGDERKDESLRLLSNLFSIKHKEESIEQAHADAKKLFKDGIKTSHLSTITEWSVKNPDEAIDLRAILGDKNNFEKYLILREKKIIDALKGDSGRVYAEFEKKMVKYEKKLADYRNFVTLNGDTDIIRKQLFGENLDDSHDWETVLTERALASPKTK